MPRGSPHSPWAMLPPPVRRNFGGLKAIVWCVTLCFLFILAFNRTKMASEGVIPILIEYMKNSEGDVVAKQYCAMALGNLAAEPENHMEIVKSEGIDALITVLRSEDIEGGRYAAFGLSNLAANANHRERIVEEGAVPCLVSLACCEDVNAQRQGIHSYLSLHRVSCRVDPSRCCCLSDGGPSRVVYQSGVPRGGGERGHFGPACADEPIRGRHGKETVTLFSGFELLLTWSVCVLRRY